MMYKKSKYNIFVPYKDGTIVFNALNGSIGLFDDQAMERYKQYLETAVDKGQLKAKTAYDYGSRLRSLEQYQEETGNVIGQVSQFNRSWVVDYLDYVV